LFFRRREQHPAGRGQMLGPPARKLGMTAQQLRAREIAVSSL
jgi:hypothetical protein